MTVLLNLLYNSLLQMYNYIYDTVINQGQVATYPYNAILLAVVNYQLLAS